MKKLMFFVFLFPIILGVAITLKISLNLFWVLLGVYLLYLIVVMFIICKKIIKKWKDYYLLYWFWCCWVVVQPLTGVMENMPSIKRITISLFSTKGCLKNLNKNHYPEGKNIKDRWGGPATCGKNKTILQWKNIIQ